MSYLKQSLIQKAGYDNGWEIIVSHNEGKTTMSSSLHSELVEVQPDGGILRVKFTIATLVTELARTNPTHTGDIFLVSGTADLGQLLNQAARLARALPDTPEKRYQKAVAEQLDGLGQTEVERIVKQRIGQNIFRESLMAYWDGKCAVTGLAIKPMLRASHIVPWAECETDADRLNVYNGLLLSANLDALFDQHLITFGQDGLIIFADYLSTEHLELIAITQDLRLRWLGDEMQPYLATHRTKFAEKQKTID